MFKTCGTCDPTCENPNPLCTLSCKVGCFCKKGYVRDFQGNCILLRKCRKLKINFDVYSNRWFRFLHQVVFSVRCYGPNESPGCLPCPEGKTCAGICPIQGCVCDPGYVRRNGICEIECKFDLGFFLISQKL